MHTSCAVIVPVHINTSRTMTLDDQSEMAFERLMLVFVRGTK